MCTGAVDTIYVLKALMEGADGVLIGGCHPGDCHYQTGNYKARRRVSIIKSILKQVGFDEDRVWLRWISASEGKLFADTAAQMVEDLKEKGPNPIKQLWMV
jgi:F420-non-reducing hydrogenase iron-sulfur subunit